MSHRTTRAFERAPTFHERQTAASFILAYCFRLVCTGSCMSRGCNCQRGLELVADAINIAQGLRLPNG